ncbi:Gfo/Idh/MocA family protein [Actinomadura mexicana]|uniref:Predicted dehydrogenase n=1 Tax=Actinomadura mexicana TaxID=134959 RepID=A0A238XCQ4_9ACTN|nr:Gfo/Idh/MocA family oxidoreductase [Actinomadura mexicana]SNR56412.1 Predicted dehydrogenase [Actinomadura mexicana]
MSVPQQLRTLIVGGRGVGAVHAQALRHVRNASVVAVAGSSQRTARETARRLGVPRWGDYRELIAAPETEVVHVCTPNDEHLPVVRAAVLAGKHVVCEKPVAATVAHAAEMVRLTTRGMGKAFLCYKYRYLPLVRRLRELVAGGVLGPIHAVRGHYLQSWKLDAAPGDWRCDPARAGFSPVLLDIGTHLIDLVEHVLGVPATRPTARIRDAGPAGLPQANVLFSAGEALGSIAVSQVSPASDNHLFLQVDGRDATATWKYDHHESLLMTRQDGPTALDTGSAGGLRQVATTGWENSEAPLASAIALFQDIYDQIQVPDRSERPPQLVDGLRHLRFFAEAFTEGGSGARAGRTHEPTATEDA